MIDIKNSIKDEVTEAKKIDEQFEQQVPKKLYESVFKPTAGSDKAICIHQSRSIIC